MTAKPRTRVEQPLIGAPRLRVLHVLGELRRSGAEMMLADSVESMNRSGISLAALSTGEQIGEMSDVFRRSGVETFHVPFNRRPPFFARVLRLARRYDVVHVHTERASFWLCAILRLAGLPVIRTVHSSFLFEGRLRRVRSWQRQALSRVGVVFVAIGREVAENEEERFGLTTTVVSNWVGERFTCAAVSRKPAGGVPLVLTVGNCGEPKNHDALIEAVGLLADKGVHLRYRHVGSESQAVVDERALAQRVAQGDAIEFFGPDDPLPHLQAASVFVMPSTREGFGLAALEAMASGTPVLLADAPGLREFRSVPGIWWASPDPASLAKALEEILSLDVAARERAAADAAAYVASVFDAQKSHDRTLSLYAALARRPSVG